MGFDGVSGREEFVADASVGSALCDECEDLALASAAFWERIVGVVLVQEFVEVTIGTTRRSSLWIVWSLVGRIGGGLRGGDVSGVGRWCGIGGGFVEVEFDGYRSVVLAWLERAAGQVG